MPRIRILGVSPSRRTITLKDGQTVPITRWLQGDIEVPEPELADRFVAGPCADGKWYAGLLEDDDFEEGP